MPAKVVLDGRLFFVLDKESGMVYIALQKFNHAMCFFQN